MRMKNKIRRSFNSAAPDVLGSVLQELPEQKSAPTARPMPTSPKTSRFREFAATAAALALLISMIGGTAWYFDNYSGPDTGNTNPTAPTGDPGITQPSDTTPPNEPLRDIYVEDLDYWAENILYPWYLRDFDYMEPEVKTPLSTVCTDSVYVLKKTMGSYSYEFHFDAWYGNLVAILVVGGSDNTVNSFIPESVAKAIALLNMGDYENNFSSQLYKVTIQLVRTGSSGYYCISITSETELYIRPYYINARTGELLALGDEVEPGYTVGPVPTEDTTPPDGLIPEDMAIEFALEYANVDEANIIACYFQMDVMGTPVYWILFDDGTYYYEITMGAYSGEILAFPTPVLMDKATLPDGRISDTMALQAALDFLGISKEQAEQIICTVETDQYRITLEYLETHFLFTVNAYNPTDITCEKYEATGATPIQARNYALDYIGTGMENVSFLRIEQDMGGEQDNPGFLVEIVTEGVEYQLSLDHYGVVLSSEKFDVGVNPDESRTDIIGWRAARDILLDSWGMTLDELTFFRYRYVTSENYPDRYEIYLDESYGASGIIVAKNGEAFYENETYNTAILTVDAITEIAMMDVSQEIRENYGAGAYAECFMITQVHYGSGVREGSIQLYYEWSLYADGLWVTYHVDAFTGEILLRDINVSDLLTDLFDEWGSWYNMALTCEFENPSTLKLSRFFYNGFPDESQTPTDEERAALQAAGVYWEEADLIRLPSGKMDDILIQYFGITLAEMDESCFDGLTYLESTDCYYMMHTDAICVEGFSIEALETLENGNLAVQYTSSRTGINVWYMELEPWGTGYQILMNFPFLYRD